MSRILAIDIGTVRIGTALSDEEQMIASPLQTIPARPSTKAIQTIVSLIETHQAIHIVYGMPLNLDGSMGRATRRVERFISKLEPEISVPIEGWDERLTSVVAERTLIEADMSRKKRKKVVDQLAASLILQSWLDAQSNKSNTLE